MEAVSGTAFVFYFETACNQVLAYAWSAIGGSFFITREFQCQIEEAFAATAKHSQGAVRRYGLDVLGLVEIIIKLDGFILLTLNHLGA